MSDIKTEIIDKLKIYYDQGVPFFQAKQNLIKEGYKAADINMATYDYQYGEKSPEANLVKQALENNPDLAERVAAGMADELQTTQDIKTFKDITRDNVIKQASAEQPEHQTSPIIKIGLSWWFWLLISLILVGIMLWLQVPIIYYAVIVGILAIIFVVRILVNKYRPTKQ